MTADDAALYDERDHALARADQAEMREAELEVELDDVRDRLAEANAQVVTLGKSNGWLHRKWFAAESARKQLEANQ